MLCQDPVIDRFLSLQSKIIQELLPAFSDIERNNSTIIITFQHTVWKEFFEEFHFPFNPGADLQLSFEFRVQNVSAVHLKQQILA